MTMFIRVYQQIFITGDDVELKTRRQNFFPPLDYKKSLIVLEKIDQFSSYEEAGTQL